MAGPEPTLFGKPKYCCMRLHYKNEETSGYFHTLRAVARNPEDDGKGSGQSRPVFSDVFSGLYAKVFPKEYMCS